jgi:hypothetical protein
MISRSTARAVLPPLLALGLVALVAVRPVDALDVPPPVGLASTGQSTVTAAGNVSVSVPPVAFTERITYADGRVRTAVLVNVAEPAGVATIVGLPDCTADAQPGVALWLDCAYAGDARPLTVAVTLTDGSRFTHTVALTD